MVLADFLMDGVTANDFPGGTCVICFWGLHLSLSVYLSLSLSLSIPRPTNFVLEASNPIITKLTVNTQVSYPYMPGKECKHHLHGAERWGRWRSWCRCSSYPFTSPGGCGGIQMTGRSTWKKAEKRVLHVCLTICIVISVWHERNMWCHVLLACWVSQKLHQ